MNATERELEAARQARSAAREALDNRVEGLRSALAGESLGQRVRHEATACARDTADQVFDVARESRWVVAATLAAVVGWLLRAPLLSLGRRLGDRMSAGEPGLSWQRWRDWVVRKVKR